MKLSDFDFGIKIMLDSEFETLGYVDSGIEQTLAYCDNISYLLKADKNKHINCIITTEDLAKQIKNTKGIAISPDPRVLFYKIHHWFFENNKYQVRYKHGIGENCNIHSSAIVSTFSKIGNNVSIGENVVIKDHVVIDDNTTIDSGAIIGCDGLLYFKDGPNIVYVKHAGGVQIGKSATILSNAIIAKSIHNSCFTTIGNNSIVGITTNIGHEAQIENNCVIAGNCVIARKARICEGAWIGPSSVIREHVIIGRNAQVKLGSIVIKSIGANQIVSGNFAVGHTRNLRRTLET